MTSISAAVATLVIATLLALSPGDVAAQSPPPPPHQSGGIQQGMAPPAPYGGGQWPAVQVRPGPPPPPRYERPPHARKGQYWMGGHYAWRGTWVWIPGAWIPRRPGCGWVPPHWQLYPYGWVWLEGYWTC